MSTHITQVNATRVEVGDVISHADAEYRVIAIERDLRSSRREPVQVWGVWTEGIGDFYAAQVRGTYLTPFRWEFPAHMAYIIENRTGQSINDEREMEI